MNSFQKANDANKIRPEDSEKLEDSWKLISYPKMHIFQKIRFFFYLLNAQLSWT